MCTYIVRINNLAKHCYFHHPTQLKTASFVLELFSTPVRTSLKQHYGN